MLKVGLTGGIGSGKTYVSQVFAGLGIPVFRADDVAKHLMNSDDELKGKIMKEFGSSIYSNKVLDRGALASIVFNNPDALDRINKLVHPYVRIAFDDWVINQSDCSYVIEEAAILFESGAYKKLDFTITVSCPENIRIGRVTKRDNISKEQVKSRIKNQWSEEQRNNTADFLLINDGNEMIIPQVLRIHNQLRRKN